MFFFPLVLQFPMQIQIRKCYFYCMRRTMYADSICSQLSYCKILSLGHILYYDFFFNSPGVKYVLLVWEKGWVQNEPYLNQEEIFHRWWKRPRSHTWTHANTETASAGSSLINTKQVNTLGWNNYPWYWYRK